MKKFSVLITTAFDGYVEIEAESKEDAINQAWDMVSKGQINAVDQFEPFTEIPYADEVEDA